MLRSQLQEIINQALKMKQKELYNKGAELILLGIRQEIH
jgi:hypothetical protein